MRAERAPGSGTSGVAEAADALSALARKLGVKMQLFYAMGEYGLGAITGAPGDEVAPQLSLKTDRQGNLCPRTLRAFTRAEATKVLVKLE